MKCWKCAKRDGYEGTWMWNGRCTCSGYQVWSSTWSDGSGRIPNQVLFGGKVFASKQDAIAAWHDSLPRRNDHYVVQKYNLTN